MKASILQISWSALAIAALPSVAQAQDAAANPSVAGSDSPDVEILVTARKREENLQDVPLSITAVTAETIEEQGLRSIVDIANITPGLSYRPGFGRNSDRPVIRGQSNIQGQPNVAFFIDGIFVTGSLTSFNLDNLERVEVIKGPQAALFGRATFAGAINYITRKPDNEFRGKASVTLVRTGYPTSTRTFPARSSPTGSSPKSTDASISSGGSMPTPSIRATRWAGAFQVAWRYDPRQADRCSRRRGALRLQPG
jgi:outer membrane receptor protein involved in Fe transport